jgi:polyisoprenoid-binding protein YceI
MRYVFSRWMLAATLALCGSGIHAAPLALNAAKSSVGVSFKQMGVSVDAAFKKFSAQVDYDPAKPEKSRAKLEIDIPSFDLGDPDYNSEVLKKEWFNASQFAKASFVSSAIRASAPGKLEVTGKLSIKGKTLELTVPLLVRKDGAATVFEGSLPIRRLAFGIGDGEWKDTSIVADEVIIKFHLTAQ